MKNEKVLKKVKEKRSLMDIIRTWQKNWIGHILRSDSTERDNGRKNGGKEESLDKSSWT